MKLTVLKWIGESSIGILGRTIEILFRITLCLLPLGVYMLLLQKRTKASKISNIMVYTNDRSIWQHVFPGFILVSIEPDGMQKFLLNLNSNFKNWVERNKYLLALLFMSSIVGLMLLIYLKGGV